jgi:hypothetical protein
MSFQRVLQRIFGRSRVWLNYTANLAEGRPPDTAIPWRTRCIHGHFRSDAFDAAAPGADRVTWLRHPVERVVSNYHHFLRHPDWANPCCRALLEGNLPLAEFAALPAMRNETTRYLAGKPAGDFRFIGVTERFAESLQVFSAIFGVKLPRTLPHENVNPGRHTETYQISPAVRDRILELNLEDLSVYHAAALRLDLLAAGRRRADPAGAGFAAGGRPEALRVAEIPGRGILSPSASG